ncbi:baseplate multidomain protein megatron [Mesorhizobium sp. A623]
MAIPRLYGTARLGGKLIWATRFEESKSTRRQGKLGPKVTEYSYFANVAFLLCEGEIAGIRRIWADEREIDREKVDIRVYNDSLAQPVDPLIEAKQGAGNAPAYRGVIDAIGIDNYMPLSDWRDGDYGGGNPDGFASPYDAQGMANAVAGGEGFDWYYPSPEARGQRERSPITDGAYGKPWTYRYKDIVNWWSNRHFNRVGGVEAAHATAWTPQGKPIWLTELGCPATDKGPNQPNVFPDPKSVESASPYFSDGGRSDSAQRRFLETHMNHWLPSGTEFEESNNPQSSVYGGRMIDTARIYPWAWDARPFPAFPLRGDLWSDGPNWDRGHWLNGRLANPGVGVLINAILVDHGQPLADTKGVEGTVEGYVIADPTSARAAIEPLAELFDIVVCEDADALLFRQAGATGLQAIDVTELAVDESGPLVETARTPDHQLPAEATLAFLNPLTEYQSTSVRSVRLGVAGSRQHGISFPGVLETGQGKALLDDWLKRIWYQRETATFSIAQPQVEILPGSIVRIPDSGSSSEFLVTQVEDGLVRKVSARQIARTTPTPWRPVRADGVTAADVPVGQPHALFLDLPAAIGEGDPQAQFRAAVWQKPWRRQALFVSPEDTGFVYRSMADQAAVLGRLAMTLEPGREGRIDRAGSILVELFDSELATVSMLQLFNGANAAAIRSALGAWEVVQFERAEEVSPQLWRLSGLLRGQLGTNDAMEMGAPAGADFVLIDDALVSAGLLESETGLLLNWRVGPSGSDLSDASFITQAEIGGVRSLLPLSPVHLKAERIGGGLKLSWIRRGRIDADRWEPIDIPLGEEREEYRIEIAPAGGEIVRGQNISDTSFVYQDADIASDFGEMPSMIDVKVRQLSVAAGWGIAAMRRFSLS